ncbi:hypothetical protein C922_04870 [Plasmodium inui San Antonio 1]|uniref:Bromo domain-containing protein n=1 Tax=Plasmodium inui San Antonio 1 TaxID=1237626 RepID=W7AHI4_9APIC|nr:hypothetical protein C922_04870 [Plasmodium inui San Antonio 1]EUD64726.1 hypothetical protein C922_04870 [Plasmodium inui San Antonio 1]
METRRSLRIRAGNPLKEEPGGGNTSIEREEPKAKEEPKTKGGGKAKEDAKKGAGGGANKDANKGASGEQEKEQKGKKTSQSDKNKKGIKRHAGGKRGDGQLEGVAEQDMSNGTNEPEEFSKKGNKTGKDGSNRVEATKGKATQRKKSLEEAKHITTADAASECKDVTSVNNRSERNVKGGGMLLRKRSSVTSEKDGANGSTSRSRKGKDGTGGISGSGIKGVKEENGGEYSLRRGRSKEGPRQNDSVKREDKGGGGSRSGKGGNIKGGKAGGEAIQPSGATPRKGSLGKGSPSKSSPGKGSSSARSPGGGSRSGRSRSKDSPDLGTPVDKRKNAAHAKRAKGTTPSIEVKMKGGATVGRAVGKATGKTSDTVVDATNEKRAHSVSSISVNNSLSGENASSQGKGKWKENREGGAEDEPIPDSHLIKNINSEELESNRAKYSINRSSTVEWNEQIDAGVSVIGGTKEGASKSPLNRSIKRRLSQIIDVMKKKQGFQRIGDQDEEYRIQFEGNESAGTGTKAGVDVIKGEVTSQKGKETTDAQGQKNNNGLFLQRVNLDVIYNKLHYDFYKGEDEFHRDMLVIFDRIRLAIEMEKNPKEKQNLYQLRCNAWMTYEGEFYKLLLSMRGTKEAKKFSSTQKELREQEEKYLAQLLLESNRTELEEREKKKEKKKEEKKKEEEKKREQEKAALGAKTKQGKTLPKLKGSGGGAEQRLKGQQLEGKQLEGKRLEEACPARGRADHEDTNKRPSSPSFSLEASRLLGGKKPAEGSNKPFRVRLRLSGFSLDDAVTVSKGDEDNRSGGASLRGSGTSCATSPEKGAVAAGAEPGVAAKIAAVEPLSEEWKKLIRDHVLQSLIRDSNTALYFTTPVLEDKNISDQIRSEYKNKIKKPMDYTTVSRNLDLGVYQNPSEFYKDLKLIFQNCLDFNPDILQNQYIVDAAKRAQERASNVWRKWKRRIVQAYEQGGYAGGESLTTPTMPTTVRMPPTATALPTATAPTTSIPPVSLASYIEFFKNMTKKKKKLSCLYTMWVEYLLANRVTFEELCTMRGIDWKELKEKSQAKVSSPREVNLNRFKKLNNRSLPFYVFREEYQAALRERREEVRKMEKLQAGEKLEGVVNLDDKGVRRDSAATDHPQDTNFRILLKDPRTWNQKQKLRPIEEGLPKEPTVKPFRSRKRRINNAIFFDEDIFDKYLEGKRSCVVKCARNVFLADCFYYGSVVESLRDFMAEGEDDIIGVETREEDLGDVNAKEEEMRVVNSNEEDFRGVNAKEEGIGGNQSAEAISREAATHRANKIAFRIRAVSEEKRARRGAVCKGFEESPVGEDETDVSWGARREGGDAGSGGDGADDRVVHERSLVEGDATRKGNEGTRVERPAEEPADAPAFHRIHQLANSATGPPQGRKKKKK